MGGLGPGRWGFRGGLVRLGLLGRYSLLSLDGTQEGDPVRILPVPRILWALKIVPRAALGVETGWSDRQTGVLGSNPSEAPSVLA